jgi:predicted kinase
MILCCTHGLARSGKTTFTKRWKTYQPNRFVVSGDDIRLAISGQRFNPKIEDYVQTVKKTMIKASLIGGADVMHEGTNTTIKSIKEMESIAIEYGVPLIWIMFETPLEECIRRAVATNQEDLIEPLKRMEEQRKESSLYLIDKYSGSDGPLYGNCRQLIDFSVSLMNGMPQISMSCEYRTDDGYSIGYSDKTTSLIRIQY